MTSELWRLKPGEVCGEGAACGMSCEFHAICSECGDLVHLGDSFASPGFGPVDALALMREIVGSPARCAECRQRRR